MKKKADPRDVEGQNAGKTTSAHREIVQQMRSQHANSSTNINIDNSLPSLSHISPKDQDNTMPLPKAGASRVQATSKDIIPELSEENASQS